MNQNKLKKVMPDRPAARSPMGHTDVKRFLIGCEYLVRNNGFIRAMDLFELGLRGHSDFFAILTGMGIVFSRKMPDGSTRRTALIKKLKYTPELAEVMLAKYAQRITIAQERRDAKAKEERVDLKLVPPTPAPEPEPEGDAHKQLEMELEVEPEVERPSLAEVLDMLCLVNGKLDMVNRKVDKFLHELCD